MAQSPQFETKDSSQNTTRDVSPLADEVTYGERMHHRIFGIGFNVLTNLGLSAMFSYWVNHSVKPIRLPFMKEALRPAAIQQNVEKTIGRALGAVSAEATPYRTKAANSMAGVATLTFIGHIVMIPSVWLGAKFKSPIVEWFNRRHYGDAAMEDPSLKARHIAIREETRPSLLGAVVGRIGTIFATQSAAYLVGHNLNLVRLGGEKLGIDFVKKFRGIDALTEEVGGRVGGMLADAAPNANARANGFIRRHGYDWSLNQLKDHPQLHNIEYGVHPRKPNGEKAVYGGGVLEHFGRYISADIMYTMVTALTINPAINFFKKFVPGMTYTPAPVPNVPDYLKDDIATIRLPKNHAVPKERPATATTMQTAVNDNPAPRIDLAHSAQLSRLEAPKTAEVGA